jgi:xylulokinase
MATTGSLTRWIRDNFAKELMEMENRGEVNAYTELFKEAENIHAGADGIIVLPYFAGERMPIKDPQAKGVIFGLNTSHTRGHIVKAAFEGIGYGINQNFDILRKSGSNINNVMAVGGGTKSKIYIQTVSDVCEITQIVPEITVGASFGDAILAGLGVGLLNSPKEVKDWIKVNYVTKPNSEYKDIYNRNKRFYSELYLRNKDIMHNL